jgi:hypothetical protein
MVPINSWGFRTFPVSFLFLVPRQEISLTKKTNKNVNSVGVWKMYFDGASYCEGAGAGLLFVAPGDDLIIPFSYRLEWDIDYTNNVCEYEALVLGLEAARKL